MKISPIANCSQNFKSIYLSRQNMPSLVDDDVKHLVKTLYCTTDITEICNNRGIDIYIYPDKKCSNRRAKVVFADKELNVFKLNKNKFSTETKYRGFGNQKDKEMSVNMGGGLEEIIDYASNLIFGKIREKTLHCNESNEIRKIFEDKNSNDILTFK